MIKRVIFALLALMLATAFTSAKVANWGITASAGKNITFTPNSISGIQVWFEGDLGVTVSTGVSAWANQATTGSTYDASQGTGSAQPTINSAALNGKDTLHFVSSSSQRLTLASTVSVDSANTVFVVMKKDTATNQCFPAGYNPGDVWIIRWDASDVLSTNNNTNGISLTSTERGYALWTFTHSGSSGGIWKNGVSQTTGTISAVGSALMSNIGSRDNFQYSDCDIASIIVYNSVLSSTDRANVESYEMTRWGL